MPTNSLFQLIGGELDKPPTFRGNPADGVLHQLETRGFGHERPGPKYVLVLMQLFAFLNSPTYCVVVGEYRAPKD